MIVFCKSTKKILGVARKRRTTRSVACVGEYRLSYVGGIAFPTRGGVGAVSPV